MHNQLVTAFHDIFSQVSSLSAQQYALKSSVLLDEVNLTLENNPEILSLVGGDLSVLRDNHRCHVEFMSSSFKIRSASTFVDIVTWVYKSYIHRGFSADYFPIELTAWKEAVWKYLDADMAKPVSDVYDLMIEMHPVFLGESMKSESASYVEPNVRPYYERYLSCILKPSSADAIAVVKEYVKDAEDVKYWWMQVIEPAMKEIGRLWADGHITVGQEHLATSITLRVMSVFYPLILELPREKGRVLFTASPGELHEIGPRMVADILEMKGWDVDYCGTDTPVDSIVSLLRSRNTRILCISTTLPFNLAPTQAYIQTVRSAFPNDPIHILVGGQAYQSDNSLWQTIGADGFASNPQVATQYLDKLEV